MRSVKNDTSDAPRAGHLRSMKKGSGVERLRKTPASSDRCRTPTRERVPWLKRARQPTLPVLLTRGYAETARCDAEADGVRILPKPFRLEELSAALATVSTNRLGQSSSARGKA